MRTSFVSAGKQGEIKILRSHMQSWQLRKKKIFFLEKPATKDEVEIASLLQDYFEAMAGADSDRLATVFSAGALIQSRAVGNKLARKDEYISKIKNELKKIRPIYFDEVLIRVHNTTTPKATAGTVFLYRFEKKIAPPRDLVFEFQKENDAWRITKQSYPPRA